MDPAHKFIEMLSLFFNDWQVIIKDVRQKAFSAAATSIEVNASNVFEALVG